MISRSMTEKEAIECFEKARVARVLAQAQKDRARLAKAEAELTRESAELAEAEAYVDLYKLLSIFPKLGEREASEKLAEAVADTRRAAVEIDASVERVEARINAISQSILLANLAIMESRDAAEEKETPRARELRERVEDEETQYRLARDSQRGCG